MKPDDPFTLDLTEYVTKGCFTAEGFKAFCEIALSINKEGFSLLEMGKWLERGRASYIKARTPKSVAEVEHVIKVRASHLPPQTLKEVLETLNGKAHG